MGFLLQCRKWHERDLTVPRVAENDVEAQRLIKAFREGLAQLGWAEGRNLRIDYRWAGGDVGRIRAFAKELVEPSPDIDQTLGMKVPRRSLESLQ